MPLSVSTSIANGVTNINMSLAAGESMQERITLSLDLTGFTVKMYIGFLTPLLLSTGNGGITLTDAAAGTLIVNILDTVSAAFTPGEYPYEFWLESGGSPVQTTRLWTGTFTVLNSITPIP